MIRRCEKCEKVDEVMKIQHKGIRPFFLCVVCYTEMLKAGRRIDKAYREMKRETSRR